MATQTISFQCDTYVAQILIATHELIICNHSTKKDEDISGITLDLYNAILDEIVDSTRHVLGDADGYSKELRAQIVEHINRKVAILLEMTRKVI